MTKPGDQSIFDQYVRHADVLRNWPIVGVVFQVVLAFINKIYNFILYYYSTRPRPQVAANAVQKRNLVSFLLIDVPLDSATLVSFAWATFLLFKFLLSMAA